MLILFRRLLRKSCNKKQETVKCFLKLECWLYLQGTYTPQGGTELSTPQGGTELSTRRVSEKFRLAVLGTYSAHFLSIENYGKCQTPLFLSGQIKV